MLICAFTLAAAAAGLFGDGIHDDTASIQAMLDTGRSVVELPAPKSHYLISRTLRLGDGQELRLGRTTRIRLAEGSDCHMLGIRDEIRGARNVVVTGGVWDMNNLGQRHNLAAHYYVGPENRHRWLDLRKEYVQTHTHRMSDKHEPDYFLGVCFRFFNVEGLTVRGVTVRNPVTYGIQLWKVRDFTVDDVVFDYAWANPSKANMDGLHIDGFCHNGRITNLRGICYDDFVALNATDGVDSPGPGPITDIDIDGIYCDYCHSAVRLLSRRPQDAIRRISIRNVHGRYYSYGIGFTYFKKEIKQRGIIDAVSVSDCRMSRADTPADTWRFDPFALVEFEPGVDVGEVSIVRLYRDEDERPEIDTIRIREGATIDRLVVRDCMQVNRCDVPMWFLHNRGKVGSLVHENTRLVSAPGANVLETDAPEERDFPRLEMKDIVSLGDACGYPRRGTMMPGGTLKAGFGEDGICLLPFTGQDSAANAGVVDEYTENGEPGFYCVVFTNFNVRAEVSVSETAGWYRFRFPEFVERKVYVRGDMHVEFSEHPVSSGQCDGGRIYRFPPGDSCLVAKAYAGDRRGDDGFDFDRAAFRARRTWLKRWQDACGK